MEVEVFKTKDALDQNKHKPLVLDWLIKYFDLPTGIRVNHFSDEFIIYSVRDSINIILDSRQDAHNKLMALIPNEFTQHNSINIPLDFMNIEYPTIVKVKETKRIRHKDDDGDIFYVYYYDVYLSDGTIVQESNQDQDKNFDYTLNWHIQERAFLKLLTADKK